MKPNRFRSNRFFLVALADHDSTFGSFMPGTEPTTLLRKIALFFTIAPAVLLVLFPSFDLGQAVFREPSFKLPDSVLVGEILSLPMGEITNPEISGRPFEAAANRNPFYFGVVSSANLPMLDLSFNFVPTDTKWHPRKLLPRFHHPGVSHFSKKIPVAEAAITPLTAKEKQIADDPALAEIFKRHDGKANAGCWREPKTTEVTTPARKHRGRISRVATVTSAAPGEVVFVSAANIAEKTVVLYHGGGLFTRYKGLKDTRLQTGQMVKEEMIGLISLDRQSIASADWDIIWEKSEINPQNFLALSAQICGSK